MSGAGIDASESIVHRSSGTLPLKHLQRYGLAVISVAVALGAALLLQRFHFGDVVVPLLLFAGAISSWYGGPGPAVLTVLLSLMGFAYFFVPPIYSLRVAPSELPYFIISAALTSLISWFATIRRRVEEAARRSETELRQLIDVIPQQVQVFDAHWNPVFANRREREYTGLTLEEARSKDALARILHPEDREKLDAIHQRALLQPAPFELEARIMGKDGLYRWFLIQENPLRDERGRVLRWYVTRTDIEDRKRAADTLRQTEAILSQAQRIARIGVWVTRPPMIPEYWSATAFEIFGIDPADGPPQDLQEFMLHVHPDDRERVMRETDVLETGRVFECKYRILRPDGTTRVIREVGSPVQESGAVQHFVGAWMDITDQEETTRELQRREAALRDSEQRWKAVFENNPTMYFMVDGRGTIQSVNPFGAEQLGYTVDELVGQSVLNVFYEPERPAVQKHAEKCFEQLGQMMRWEARKVRKDGTIIWVRETAKAVILEKLPVLLVACEDVTARKQSEAALEEQASLLSLTHDAILVRDMNKVITYWNRGAEELYGYTAEQAVGKVIHDLLKTVFPAPVEQLEAVLLRTGRWEGELVHTKRDGTQVVVASRWSLQRDERGTPVAILATNNDISERKRAEEAARRSEKELRDAINTVPAYVWSTLPDGPVDFINQRWQEFTALPPEAALGWNWESVVHSEDRARFVAEWRTALQNGRSMESEIRVRRADGEHRWWFVRNVPLLDEQGQIVKWYGTAIDIDDRKQAEEALRQAQAALAHMTRVITMGELVASIAHEVNQPLTGVVAHAGTCLRWLAAQPPDMEEARQSLELIVKDGNRAAEVIGRIRGLVKKVPPRRDRLEINTAILEVIALTHSELQTKSVELRTHLASDLPLVAADRVQLQQVILNLIVNAIEAMSAVGNRPRELVVNTGGCDSNKVFVEVRDSGPGLDPANLPRLFDSFYTSKPEGMGMGLSISRSIIAAHGGRLWATPNQPHGAVFRFTLPVESDKTS